MRVTLADLAERFVGMKEVQGAGTNAQILAMLRLDQDWPATDEVPWCSAFVNYLAWLLRLPRSKSLAARSWLSIGTPVRLDEAKRGFDVCVFQRSGQDPDEVNHPPYRTDLPGHVAVFVKFVGKNVYVYGGNQGDQVSLVGYPTTQLLAIRRLYDDTQA